METSAQSVLSTRDELLAVATELIQEVGYASFSFRDLAERVGIKAPSIHYHFPTKADLGVALVARQREESEQRKQTWISQHADVRDRLMAIANFIDSQICQCTKSCPLYSLMAEYAVLPEALQTATTAWFEERLTSLAAWLEEGRNQGVLRFPGSSVDQAKLVWSVFQYGGQLVRIGAEPSVTRLTRHLLATMSP